MNEFDRLSLQFYLHAALKCITDGKHDLAVRTIEQAVKILDRSGENEKVNESGIN